MKQHCAGTEGVFAATGSLQQLCRWPIGEANATVIGASSNTITVAASTARIGLRANILVD